MKTIIAGSREIFNANHVRKAIEESGFIITEVVCGTARGVDTLGSKYAEQRGIPVVKFPAAWRDKDGQVNHGAGFQRNQRMAEYSDALIAVWDGQSPGTKDMIDRATKRGLVVHVRIVS